MKSRLHILLLLLIFSCNRNQETIHPEKSSITESVYAVGMIKSVNQYQAFAMANGTIDSLFVEEGDTVLSGSPLLLISGETQKLNLENAKLNAQYADIGTNQSQLDEALENIKLTRNKLETDSLMFMRQANLWKQNIGSKVEYEQRELAFKSSKNTYHSAIIRYNNLKKQLLLTSQQSKNTLKIYKNQAGDFVLKSELNGVIYKIYHKKGEAINPATPLVLLGEANNYILEMQVDEYDIFKIRNGQKVLITMDSYKGKVFEAVVSKIAPVMNENSKSFTVEAIFTKGPEKLYPFISFEANIVLEEKKNALLIPRKYLIHDSLVIKESGDTVSVKTGLKDYRMVEILSGLTENEEIIKPR